MKEILLTSSVLIAVLLLLRVIFAKKVSRRLIYGAWILVALRLLIPVQIGQIDFSILTSAKPITEAITEVSNKQVAGVTEQDAYREIIKDYVEKDQTVFTPEVQEHIQSAIKDQMPGEEIAVMIDKIYAEQEIFVPEVQQQVQQIVQEAKDPITLGQIATAVWLAGIAVMALWFVAVNAIYSRRLKRNRQKLDVDCPLTVYVSENAASPCLMGLFRPVIYLTPVAAEEETLRHVLAHELTHRKHLDHIWSLVRCICLCVYWFDPLVWAAAWCSRRDCELACDEGALKRLGEEERIAYGKSLLDVVSHASRPVNLMQTATAMNETKKQLKERVNFIVKKPKLSLVAAVCMVLACAIVAGCAAAGAGNVEKPTISTTQPPEPTQPKNTTKQITLLMRRVSQTEDTTHYEEIVPKYDEQWNVTGYTHDFGATTDNEYEIVVEHKARRVVVYDAKGVMVAEYLYREDGNCATEKTYKGEPAQLHVEREYTYDDAGRLVEYVACNYQYYSNNEGYRKTRECFSYDENGNLISRTYFDQSGPDEEVVFPESLGGEWRYTYDAQGLLVRSEFYQYGDTLYSYTIYTYDASSRTVTEKTYNKNDHLDNVKTTRYDVEGRVVTITEQYDPDFDGYIEVTDYTYQTVEVPSDFFAPEFFDIPMADTKFWE